MIDVNSKAYETSYAYDMKAIAASEFCDENGVEVIHSGNGMWRWKRGDVHSYDVGNGFFDTRAEAAINCLNFYMLRP